MLTLLAFFGVISVVFMDFAVAAKFGDSTSQKCSSVVTAYYYRVKLIFYK